MVLSGCMVPHGCPSLSGCPAPGGFQHPWALSRLSPAPIAAAPSSAPAQGQVCHLPRPLLRINELALRSPGNHPPASPAQVGGAEPPLGVLGLGRAAFLPPPPPPHPALRHQGSPAGGSFVSGRDTHPLRMGARDAEGPHPAPWGGLRAEHPLGHPPGTLESTRTPLAACKGGRQS